MARTTTTASAAPTSGASRKTQTCASGSPPTNSAGPSERAGFTEVPVSGIPTRWTAVSDSPIARPAKPGVADLP